MHCISIIIYFFYFHVNFLLLFYILFLFLIHTLLSEVIYLKKVIFKGCGTALVTPFTYDGINFEELRKLIEFQILEGIDSIIICGTTGESSTMSLEEKKSVIDFSVKIVNNRVPVIAGTGGNNTKDVIELSKYAEKVGVDGLLLVTPYYNKTTQNRFNLSLLRNF